MIRHTAGAIIVPRACDTFIYSRHADDDPERPAATWCNEWQTSIMPAPAFSYTCDACHELALEWHRRDVERGAYTRYVWRRLDGGTQPAL